MKVVGKGARILRGPTGKNLYYNTSSVDLGGGEAADVILDTKDVAAGTYFLYVTNLNHLSNDTEDYGGMMTEISCQRSIAIRRSEMKDGFVETFFTQADSRRFNMNREVAKQAVIGSVLALLLLAGVLPAAAAITGVTGTQFNLVAREGYVSTPDGGSVYSWGYALDTGLMQYPGPTLIVNQGATITVTLKNELPAPAGNVSIVFPGHAAAASGGVAGKLTREAPAGGATTVTYTFTATNPGTYSYHSGTSVGLQVDMGLVGAIIVRPAGFNSAEPNSLRPCGLAVHLREPLPADGDGRDTSTMPCQAGVAAGVVNVDTTTFFPVTWFINGRCAPDTMLEDGVPWLPHQPYGAMVMMHPGDKVLLRLIGGGRDLHPFHHHGNNSLVIARDGKLLGTHSRSRGRLGRVGFHIKLSIPAARWMQSSPGPASGRPSRRPTLFSSRRRSTRTGSRAPSRTRSTGS